MDCEQEKGDEDEEPRYQCHEECGLHRTLCTLSGDEWLDFKYKYGNISCDSVSTGSAGTEVLNWSDEGFEL